MATEWSAKDTTTHQDHVIAHVLGATWLGHFIEDEALYVLLDIGFIWMIYLDGEMGLLTASSCHRGVGGRREKTIRASS